MTAFGALLLHSAMRSQLEFVQSPALSSRDLLPRLGANAHARESCRAALLVGATATPSPEPAAVFGKPVQEKQPSRISGTNSLWRWVKPGAA